jgi:hypothetical protein
MNTHRRSRITTALLLAGMLALPTFGLAQTVTTTPGGANVTGKLGTRYEPFVGPDSQAVVAGLRDGAAITLPATDPANTTGVVVIQSPTGPMGYGNVDKSLALAQTRLAQHGIYQPTAEQLQAALTGGDVLTPTGAVVHLDGVLTLRSQGMGWGDIAHQYGVRLGDVVNGKAATYVAPGEATAPLAAKGKGVVTAAGVSPESAGAASGKGNATGKGIVSAAGSQLGGPTSAGKSAQAPGRGIVTAGGGSPGASTIAPGTSGGAGKGIVTAGGTAAPIGGGNGKGQALGHSK